MAPTSKGKVFRELDPAPDAQPSAVLVLLFTDESTQELSVLLTLRSSWLNSHSGQISFPGGMCELKESSEQTALRETFEETGIQPDNIEILGHMSNLFVPPSKALITPVVAYIPQLPAIRMNPGEVEKVIKQPLYPFLDEDFRHVEFREMNRYEADVPFWDLKQKTPLWGATAMMLMELIELYREFQEELKTDTNT